MTWYVIAWYVRLEIHKQSIHHWKSKYTYHHPRLLVVVFFQYSVLSVLTNVRNDSQTFWKSKNKFSNVGYCCFSLHIHHMNGYVNSTDAVWMLISDCGWDCVFSSTGSTSKDCFAVDALYHTALNYRQWFSSTQKGIASLTLLLPFLYPLLRTALPHDN